MGEVLNLMRAPEDIVCVLVRFSDGSECWVPRDEYYRNPELGSILLSGTRISGESGAVLVDGRIVANVRGWTGAIGRVL